MKKIANTWTLPFKTLGSCNLKIVDSEGNAVLDYLGETPVENVLKILNNSEEIPPEPLIQEYSVNGPEIYVKDRLYIRIRGWGYLTGIGGLGLKPEEAIKRQNILRSYVLSKIA